MYNPLIEDVKTTITELLKLYHDYIEINERDRQLAEEMENLVARNQEHSFRYQKLVDNNPDALAGYVKHVEALIKLSPALELCMKDHSLQIQDSLPKISMLTQALNAVETVVAHGLQNLPHEELKAFNQHEKEKVAALKSAYPYLEKSHQSLRKRFDTIKRELDVYEPAAPSKA